MNPRAGDPGCFGNWPPLWSPIDPEEESWEPTGDEPMGTKEKQWLRSPKEIDWLLKRGMQSRDRGEDWAECLVHALAGLIGVPTACVRPATCSGRRAILSRSVLHSDERLEHGNELLARCNEHYESHNRRVNTGYTVAAVHDALARIASPTAATAKWSAFGCWAGFVVLDAWVAGMDRHHENWAIARGPSDVRLAPSFDHGNALGFAETEQSVQQLRKPSECEKWCEKGRSQHFAGRPSLVDVAREALSLSGPATERYWLGRLGDVSATDVDLVLRAVPSYVLSDPRRSFIQRVLDVNRRRLLDAVTP